MTADARATAWLDRLAELFPPAAPEPFWRNCGCKEATGEFTSVDYCHQAGLCAMRERDRERDEAARALLALTRGVATLAEELEAEAARLVPMTSTLTRTTHRVKRENAARLRRLLADAAPDTPTAERTQP